MIITTLLLATLSIPTDGDPYDVALEYCTSQGSTLAQYTVKDDKVIFTCSNDLTKRITITR